MVGGDDSLHRQYLLAVHADAEARSQLSEVLRKRSSARARLRREPRSVQHLNRLCDAELAYASALSSQGVTRANLECLRARYEFITQED